MLKVLPAQLPWWLAGPGLGLCVAGLYGLANRRARGFRCPAGGGGRPYRGLARGALAGGIPRRGDRRCARRGPAMFRSWR